MSAKINDNKKSSHLTTLKVAEAEQRDVGRKIARVDPDIASRLNIVSGDALELSALGRKTTVLNWPAKESDRGKGLIRIDGLIRNRLDVGINDLIEIRVVESKSAKSITFAPIEPLRIMGAEEFLAEYLDGALMTKGDTIPISVMGRRIDLVVISTNPSGPVIINNSTDIVVSEESSKAVEIAKGGGGDTSASITYEDIGGLGDAVSRVREMIELPLRHPELFKRLGVEAPKGVLLHGPPGTGKTLLAKAVANETNSSFYTIGGPEIMSKYHGESEERLRNVFEQAEKNAPSIIFIDEIDSIAPKREEVTGEVERRIVAQLLTLMDGLEPRQNIVVIGATNRREAIDEALRRPGRFDREIVIGVPDEDGRRQVLGIHTRGMPLAENVDLDALARTTYGFVGADLSALAREAAMEALRRVLPNINLRDGIPTEVLESLEVCQEDFTNALKRVQPSALREIMIQVPNVTWADIGGLGEVQMRLREGIELPLKNADAFRRIGIRAAKGFLLFGPPGTGKTLLAKAVAREAQANFVATKSSDLLSKWYGESEQQVSRLFARARQVAPTVIFIDEIDSLAPARGGSLGEPAVTERVVNTILAEMDGLEELQGVVVMAATNRPNLLDPALLRPGRFDELVYVSVPDAQGRRHILGIHTKGMPLASDVDLDSIAERTDR